MDEINKDISDTLHKADLCRWIFYILILAVIGYVLSGPVLSALERNDYERPKVVRI